MNVSAIIVTRGNVSLAPIWASLPDEWEYLIWNNSAQIVSRTRTGDRLWETVADTADLSVYGRYAAIEYASHDLIYVQDDDVIVSDPQAIVDAWIFSRDHHDDGFPRVPAALRTRHLVANMPQEFRHEGYIDSCLVGFGAAFHRNLPASAFKRFGDAQAASHPDVDPDFVREWSARYSPFFNRTCDVVFTALTPRVLVDVPKTNREFAEDPDRMYRQPEHVGERARMLDLARKVPDES